MYANDIMPNTQMLFLAEASIFSRGGLCRLGKPCEWSVWNRIFSENWRNLSGGCNGSPFFCSDQAFRKWLTRNNFVTAKRSATNAAYIF